MERFTDFYKNNLGYKMYNNALKSCIVLPKYDRVKNNTHLLTMEVENFTTTEMMNALNSKDKNLVELNNRHMTKSVKEIINHIPNLERDILNVGEIHINKSGIDIMKIKRVNANMTDSSRVGFIELNSYSDELSRQSSLKLRRFGVVLTILYASYFGYQINKLQNNIQPRTNNK